MSDETPTLKFDASLVERGAVARDWREAVKVAGKLLIDAGCARSGYSTRLIEVIEKYGPYMVVAPGLALVHAQPGPDSLHRGMSAVTFPDGVNFGHAHYDPVGLVIGIVTTNPSMHLDVIAGIATGLDGDKHLVPRAIASKSDEALVELVRQHLTSLDLGSPAGS